METLTYSPLLGVLVSMITRYLRHARWFRWIKPDDTKKVKAAAGVISALVVVAVALVNGDIAEDTVSGLLASVLSLISTLGVSTFTHEWLLKDPAKD